MISRVAEHCFWFGRYLERAESTARVLGVTSHLALDGELSRAQCWPPVLRVAGEHERFVAARGEAADCDGEVVQRYMTWDGANPTSIVANVAAARDNARSIREVVSLEAWETVNELYLWLSAADGSARAPSELVAHAHGSRAEYDGDRHEFYLKVRRSVQLGLGLLRSTMLHDPPLDFIWLGVMLERVGQTARALDVHHHAFQHMPARHQVVETSLWLGLLRACSGYEPFMKRHQGRVSAASVAAFLFLEPSFPRSLRYCLHSGFQLLCRIRPPSEPALPGSATYERLRSLDAWLADLRPDALDPEAMHALLTRVVEETAAACNDIDRELLGSGPVTD